MARYDEGYTCPNWHKNSTYESRRLGHGREQAKLVLAKLASWCSALVLGWELAASETASAMACMCWGSQLVSASSATEWGLESVLESWEQLSACHGQFGEEWGLGSVGLSSAWRSGWVWSGTE